MTFSVDAIDAHAEGQHGRVVVGGVGRLAAPGATMFEKMKHFEEHGDWFVSSCSASPAVTPAHASTCCCRQPTPGPTRDS